MNPLDNIRRRGRLIGGPCNGRDWPMPLPPDMAWPKFGCSAMASPKPRVWHHYTHVGDGTYRYAGPCAEIDHDGAPPHDHCDHRWRDPSSHRCDLVYAHDGDHVCGCCNARTPA